MRLLAVAVSLLLPIVPVAAQVATGSYAYGTFDGHGFDSVNVGNLNVHFGVPIINKSGRGLPFYYNLSYDSSVWYPSSASGSLVWTPVQSFGWRGDTEVAAGYISYNTSTSVRGNCSVQTVTNWIYHDTYGVMHPFAGMATRYIQLNKYTCPSSQLSFTAEARDNSGYTLAVTNMYTAVLTTASSRVINAPISASGSGTVTDANGNQVSTDGNGNFTDTTGKVVLQVAGNTTSAQTFTYTDAGGTARAVTVNYKPYTVQTYFNCGGIGEYGPTSTSLVDTIQHSRWPERLPLQL